MGEIQQHLARVKMQEMEVQNALTHARGMEQHAELLKQELKLKEKQTDAALQHAKELELQAQHHKEWAEQQEQKAMHMQASNESLKDIVNLTRKELELKEKVFEKKHRKLQKKLANSTTTSVPDSMMSTSAPSMNPSP